MAVPTTTAQAPRVLPDRHPLCAHHCDELILEAHLVAVIGNTPPHESLLWILWGTRLTTARENGQNIRALRRLGGSEEKHGWRAVTGNERTARVDHALQVHGGQVLLDEWLAKLSLHE